MNRRVLALLVLGLAAVPGVAAGQGKPFRVHAPAANAIVSGRGLIHVIVEVDPALEPAALRARLGRVDLGPGTWSARAAGGGVLHWVARVVPGKNVLEAVATPSGLPPIVERRELFYLAPMDGGENPPRDFARVPFDHQGADAVCGECHVTRASSLDLAPPAPAQSTCYSCHAGLTRAKEVHGPAALWACTRCHDPTASPYPFATPDQVMPLCFGCHEEQRQRFDRSPYRHGPTATGLCTTCHDPHGTEHTFFLRKATFDLCTTCHAEKASGRHVIAWGSRSEGHPVRGVPDPRRPGRELSCASCHDPHAAPGPHLWTFDAVTWLDLCRNCHRRIVGN